MITLHMRPIGLSEREKHLELMYMMVCDLIASKSSEEMNRNLLRLTTVKAALDEMPGYVTLDS